MAGAHGGGAASIAAAPLDRSAGAGAAPIDQPDDIAASHGGGPRVGSAAVAVADGDRAGAAGAVAGGQVGAAVAGDASGAAGGGAAGQLADGNVRGAAADRAGVDSRVAGIQSRDDARHVAEDDATAAGREESGLAEADRRRGAAESRAMGERRHAEATVDVEGRARSEVAGAQGDARGRAEGEVPGQVRGSVSQAEQAEHAGDQTGHGPQPDAPSDVRAARFRAEAEVGRARSDAHRPESEARGAELVAESRTADARDPSGAAARHESVSRSEHLGESESASRRAEEEAAHPDRAAKDRARKLDDE